MHYQATALVLLIALFCVLSVAEIDETPQQGCGVPPSPLPVPKLATKQCWLRSVVPTSQLVPRAPLVPNRSTARQAATWRQLRQLVRDHPDVPLYIHLSGRVMVDQPLTVQRRTAPLLVVGPAEVLPAGEATHTPAIVIRHSSSVVVKHLSFSGFQEGAIKVVNSTGLTGQHTGHLPVVISAKSSSPAVMLAGVSFTNCSSSGLYGAGLEVDRSRLSLQGCRFDHNTAQWCGAAAMVKRSALLVINSTFTNNLGNNTVLDDKCRGGAIHAHKSWLAAVGCRFYNNTGVNGSAIAITSPVGIIQLHDSVFDRNSARPGACTHFSTTAGAVSVQDMQRDYHNISKVTRWAQLKPAAAGACEESISGLVVVRCNFTGNSAAVIGGHGGSIAVYSSFLAVINSTFNGSMVPHTKINETDRAACTSSGLDADQGGCISVTTSRLFIQGSSFWHCTSFRFGGAVFAHTTDAAILDSSLAHSQSEQGGGLAVVNGVLHLRNVTVQHCRSLQTAAGMYFESNWILDLHASDIHLHHGTTPGRSGGLLAMTTGDTSELYMSVTNSTFLHNQGFFCGALGIESATQAELRNNLIANNTAGISGGGLRCANFFGTTHSLRLVNNTWLNNTSKGHAGGVALQPCDNVTVHGDRFLGNHADEEGAGFMVHGGINVRLQKVQISCNTAPQAAGMLVKISDLGKPSTPVVLCSNITANGGSPHPEARAACLKQAQRVSKGRGKLRLLESTSPGTTSGVAAPPPATMPGTEQGGGLLVATGQHVTLLGTSITHNQATSAGAGLYVDGGKVTMASNGTLPASFIGHNACPEGLGAGVHLTEEAVLEANNTNWGHNTAMYGGAVFASGPQTLLRLAAVNMSNNTAVAGGAIATLSGSKVTCVEDCSFMYNKAKAGGALILHEGNNTLARATFLHNSAAALSLGSSTSASDPGGMMQDRISMYVDTSPGQVSSMAGGAVYVWRGTLTLQECMLVGNVAWGAAGQGGGVFVDDGRLSLLGSTLMLNWAGVAGGGVCLGGQGSGQLRVLNSSMFGNNAGQYGGGIAAGLVLVADAGRAQQVDAGLPPLSNDDHSGQGALRSLSRAGTWRVDVRSSSLAVNAAGEQGGALACQFCDTLVLAHSVMELNLAANAGGGISCIGCGALQLDNSSFLYNAAATGGGACVIAAGPGSSARDMLFEGNYAGSGASPVSHTCVDRAASDAWVLLHGSSGHGGDVGGTVPAHAHWSAGSSHLPEPNQTFPGCGVVGAGGGLCIGLSRAGFKLQGRNRFVGNAAAYGAGLHVQGCAHALADCSLNMEASAAVFDRDFIQDVDWGLPDALRSQLLSHRHTPAQGAWAEGSSSLYQGDLAEPSTVVSGPAPAPQSSGPKLLRGPQALDGVGAQLHAARPTAPQLAVASTTNGTGPGPASGAGADMYVTRLHAWPPARHTSAPDATGPLPAASQDTSPHKAQGSLPGAAASAPGSMRMATDPCKLGNLQVEGPGAGAAPQPTGQGAAATVSPPLASGATSGVAHAAVTSSAVSIHTTTTIDGKVLQAVTLPVEDELAGAVADDVAQQLTVQATPHFKDCSACRLTGVSKVVPVNGTAHFKQLGVLAPPGSKQSISFLLLSASSGQEMHRSTQALLLDLPQCSRGQATTPVGCFDCSSPLYTFSPVTSTCSICPTNTEVCSHTSLIPAAGFWVSGPLGTQLPRCTRARACQRTPEQVKALQCLQQQQLELLDPAAAAGDIFKEHSRHTTVWTEMQQMCKPILEQLHAGLQGLAAPQGVNTDAGRRLAGVSAPTNGSAEAAGDTGMHWTPDVVASLYAQRLCSQGYTGTFCSSCTFPGTAAQGGAYGLTYRGCSPCPPRSSAVAWYSLARLFDLVVLGVILAILLLEMQRRKSRVATAAVAALRSSNSSSTGTPKTALQQQQQLSQQRSTQPQQQQSASQQASQPMGAAAGGAAAAGGGAGGGQPAGSKIKKRRRSPLFAAELAQCSSSSGRRSASLKVLNYSPSRLTTGQVFEVMKDFMQILSILQLALGGWQAATEQVLAGLSLTPLSTKAWLSLDCALPRTPAMADRLAVLRLAAQLALPPATMVLLLLVWLAYAVVVTATRNQVFIRVLCRLKPGIVGTMLATLSFFYPSLAFAVLSVFSCRQLEFDAPASWLQPGPATGAQADSVRYVWLWSGDMNLTCFSEPRHRALVLGVGIPGTLLLLVYPILQAVLLARQAAAGQLEYTTAFFAGYGQLVEDFRPRLFFWGSVVELRKLVLVAVVLGLASTGVASQLLGCGLVLLLSFAAVLALLPYPCTLLNKLHLASCVVLLAVVWLNLLLDLTGDNSHSISQGLTQQQSMAVQLCSLVIVVLMLLLLVVLWLRRVWASVASFLDQDKDGRISRADLTARWAQVAAAACGKCGAK